MGFKATHNIKHNLDAFVLYELGYNDGDSGKEAFSQREAVAGFMGTYGKAYFGRTSSEYKMAGVKIDPFNDTASGTGLGGPNFGISGFTGDFFDDTLGYISPEFLTDGLKANAAIFIDDSNQDSHDYNLGLSYETEALDLYAQVMFIDDGADYNVLAGDETAIRVSGQYKHSNFIIGSSYENYDKADVNYFYLTGSYLIGDEKISVSYGDVEKTGTGFSARYFHNLTKEIVIYGLHKDGDGDVVTDDRTASSLGLTY